MWVCNLCRKQQEILTKSGVWFYSDPEGSRSGPQDKVRGGPVGANQDPLRNGSGIPGRSESHTLFTLLGLRQCKMLLSSALCGSDVVRRLLSLSQLTVRKTRPPLVTVAMTDKQCCSHTTHMFSRSEKNIAEQRGN